MTLIAEIEGNVPDSLLLRGDVCWLSAETPVINTRQSDAVTRMRQSAEWFMVIEKEHVNLSNHDKCQLGLRKRTCEKYGYAIGWSHEVC